MGCGSAGGVTPPSETPWHLWPGAPAPGTFLCALDEIANPGAKGFVFGEGAERFDMFVVRNGDMIAGFVNACPHIGTPLEFMPDQFLTADKTQIVCATHGAQFRISDGFCVAGPCKDKSLQPVPIDVIEGRLAIGTSR